jgi:uncharacterized protein (DUF934 family)
MKFIDTAHDAWHAVVGEDGPLVNITPAPNQLLTLAQWHSARATWPEGLKAGVALANDEEVTDIAADLPRIAVVALNFPKWVDGRAYSQAHVLRSRYRFAGEIRATGEVLVDMLPLLKRTGVDAVAMRRDQDIEAAHRALGFFAGHYQGDTAEHRPVFARPADEQPSFNQQGSAI